MPVLTGALVAGLLPAAAVGSTTTVPATDAGRADDTVRDADTRGAWPAEAALGRLLVTTDDGLAAHALASSPLTGTDAEALAPALVQVEVPAGQEPAHAAALAARPGVRAVEPDWLLRPQAVPDDPAYAEQWAHARTGAPAAWARRSDARAARIAVIDTGVHAGHPDLADQVTEQVDASTGQVTEPPRRGVDNDPCETGHGTWVSGIAAAAGDNARDVAGVAWRADVLDISVASCRDGATCSGVQMSRIIAGIDYAVHGTAKPAKVISISMGGYLDDCPSSLRAAVDRAWEAGAVIVSSAGNGELDPATAGRTSFPASCAHVVSVAATGPRDRRAPYSTRNSEVDIAAPGGDTSKDRAGGVLTTHRGFPRNPTRLVQGTSFAAPYVAGVVALLRAQRPDLGPDEIVRVLLDTAEDLGDAGRDREYGHGMVRPAAALAALAGAPAPAVPSTPAPDGTVEPPAAPTAQVPAPTVSRVSAGDGATRAVEQAVAVSRLAFAQGAARHAVLARADHFADALAGSALAMGAGPVLFAPGDGTLPTAVREELRRVLPEGARVYVLGGPKALPSALDEAVSEIGRRPIRLAGPNREATAAAVAGEVPRRRAALGLPPAAGVLLTTGADWPDAVTGGWLASLTGAPVLLTGADTLHPAAAAALRQLAPARVTVAGGEGAVPAAVADAAGQAARAPVRRLAGPARDATAVAVARAALAELARDGRAPRYAVAVNLRRADAFAHALSASALAGVAGAVLVPVEEADGSRLTDTARAWAQADLGDPATDVLLIGDADLVAEAVGTQLRLLVQRARATRLAAEQE